MTISELKPQNTERNFGLCLTFYIIFFFKLWLGWVFYQNSSLCIHKFWKHKKKSRKILPQFQNSKIIRKKIFSVHGLIAPKAISFVLRIYNLIILYIYSLNFNAFAWHFFAFKIDPFLFSRTKKKEPCFKSERVGSGNENIMQRNVNESCCKFT